MELWIIFALLAQLTWAFTSIIDKIVISKGYIRNPLVFIVLNGAMNIFLVFLLPFVQFEPIEVSHFLVALFSSIAVTAGVILYYESVKHEEISRIHIIYQLLPIFTLILSFIFLNEILSGNDFIGFVFLTLGGLAVAYKRNMGKFKLSPAFLIILASSFFIAAAYVLAKYLFTVTSFWNAVLWLRATQTIAVCVLFIPSVRLDFVETYRGMRTNIKGLLSFKMVIDFGAFIISDAAIFFGPVALVSALSSSSIPLFVFVLALFFSIYFPKIIKEDTDTRTIASKIAALILVIAGILLVSL